MLIIDFNKQISIFAPGKCGSSALAVNLHPFTVNQNEFYRHSHIKIISSKPLSVTSSDLVDTLHISFYSLRTADSYVMYRKLYSENNFKHYVFVREPVDRTISGFETVINHYTTPLWHQYQKDELPLEYLWEVAQRQKSYDYHIRPYLKRISKYNITYHNIKHINKFLLQKYDIVGEEVPSIPLRDKQSSIDTIKKEMKKFRNDCAKQFDSVIANTDILNEIELYKELDIKE